MPVIEFSILSNFPYLESADSKDPSEVGIKHTRQASKSTSISGSLQFKNQQNTSWAIIEITCHLHCSKLLNIQFSSAQRRVLHILSRL